MKQKDRLLENLRAYFNEGELRDLCFSLDINYDTLAGNSMADKARELILYLDRRQQLPELLEIAARLRPSASWLEEQRVDQARVQALLDTHAATYFLRQFPDTIRTDFETAEEVWLVGFSLVRTIRPVLHIIEDKLKHGHMLRVLVVDPDAPGVELAVQRSYKPTNLGRKRGEILGTLTDLCALREEASGNLLIRTTHFPLEYGAQAMNPETDAGVIYVKLYPFKIKGEKPKFMLRPSYGPWYGVFLDELKALWDSGTDWQCR